MNYITRLAVCTGIFALGGCVTATYTYTVTDADGRSCSLSIKSKRDLAGGFAGSIKKCDLVAETASATGGQTDFAQLLQAALALAPYLPKQPIPEQPTATQDN